MDELYVDNGYFEYGYIQRFLNISSDFTSDFISSISNSRIRDLISNSTSEFISSITNFRDRVSSSNFTSDFISSIDNNRIREFDISLSSDFLSTVDNNRVRNLNIDLNSESSVSLLFTTSLLDFNSYYLKYKQQKVKISNFSINKIIIK